MTFEEFVETYKCECVNYIEYLGEEK